MALTPPTRARPRASLPRAIDARGRIPIVAFARLARVRARARDAYLVRRLRVLVRRAKNLRERNHPMRASSASSLSRIARRRASIDRCISRAFVHIARVSCASSRASRRRVRRLTAGRRRRSAREAIEGECAPRAVRATTRDARARRARMRRVSHRSSRTASAAASSHGCAHGLRPRAPVCGDGGRTGPRVESPCLESRTVKGAGTARRARERRRCVRARERML